ncbi:hypothetical protein FRC10_010000 [Ceratobasidium sp. 414]|nr:hypothetical protein FRC10_010000 [Ceratobasidium sp. 414]
MHNLTTAEGLLSYLETTEFAATDVQCLSGGANAFTYRAVLKNPLSNGETSIIVKHSEGYLALDAVRKVQAERSMYEYEALVALCASGLFDSNSTVQVPKPLFFDQETYTIIMTDLSPLEGLTKFLTDSVEGVNSGKDVDVESKLKVACALASGIGLALGDFLGRFHNWSSQPEQAALRKRFARNITSTKQCLSIGYDVASQSAKRFGLAGPSLNTLDEAGREADTGGDILSHGDLWIDNVQVSRAPDGSLRLYVIDWEMVSLAPPEFDIGVFTGMAAPFARRYSVQEVYPLIPAMHQAYSKHRTLDPLKSARLVGIYMMGFGTLGSEWTAGQNDDFLKQIALEGFELLELSQNGDQDANEDPLLKYGFDPVVGRTGFPNFMTGILCCNVIPNVDLRTQYCSELSCQFGTYYGAKVPGESRESILNDPARGHGINTTSGEPGWCGTNEWAERVMKCGWSPFVVDWPRLLLLYSPVHGPWQAAYINWSPDTYYPTPTCLMATTMLSQMNGSTVTYSSLHAYNDALYQYTRKQFEDAERGARRQREQRASGGNPKPHTPNSA